MRNTYQKKFYSSKEIDRIITNHANATGRGYSEALRHIVSEWSGELICIPKAGYVRDGAITIEEELARR